MEPENILRIMALYDFKAPINVIIYDENSDDEKNSKKYVTENNASTTSNIISMKSNIKVEKNEESEDCALVISTLPEMCKGNEEDKSTVINDEECVQYETEHFNKSEEPMKTGRRKRKSSDLFYEKKVITKQNHVQVLDKISETLQDKNSSLDSGTPTLLEDNDDVINDPLKTVSHFLIVIAESYNYHLNIRNKKATKKNKNVSKKHYLEIKYHFFKIAYEIVQTNIIPKENDRKFVDEFLNSTIKIAEKKTKFDSSKIIETLYIELIQWVKQKKRKEAALKNADDLKPDNILLEKSSQPSMLDLNTGNQHDNNNIRDSVTNTKSKNHSKSLPTCILTPELAGEEISINYNTALSNNQNNKSIINNDISCNENIRSQNPLSAMQLFHYLKSCNNSNTLNNDLRSTDISTNTIPFINDDSIQSNAKENTHNETLNKTIESSNKQNDNTVINDCISSDENIQRQNSISTLHRYTQNCNYNRPLNNGTKTIDVPTDTVPLANYNNMQPNNHEIARSKSKVKKKKISNERHDKAIMNGDITSNEMIKSKNPLLLNYLQNCNDNRWLINRPAGTDIRMDTIPLVDRNNVQTIGNEVPHNQNMSGISYHQIPSFGSTTIQYACNSTIPSRYCQNTNIANNSAIDVIDPDHSNVNLDIVNSSPYPMSNKNTNMVFNRDQILNSSQASTNIHPCTDSFVTHSQTTSDTSYLQIPSTRSNVLHSPYYHKSIPVSSSTPPHCFQNTIDQRIYSNQNPINDNSSNAMNVLSNQVLNSQHSIAANRISDNDRIINDIRPPPPEYNTTHYLLGQNNNNYLNNLANKNSATLPQYFPSCVNRPISSSVVDQRQNFLENRVVNFVQHQEPTVHPPPPNRVPIRQDHVPLAQNYAPSAIQYNVQPEPIHSRSTVSTDSGFASPLACEDGGNNTEVIEDTLFDLVDTTSITSDAMSSLPIITHVTSLNTSISLVKEGNCYMCGKIAKQMCSGCYRLYYCSTNCQVADWRIHRHNCGHNKIN